jgi:protein tyrosine phosphatase (PTP) superfamily phosphohydrolase (DUF442 family)
MVLNIKHKIELLLITFLFLCSGSLMSQPSYLQNKKYAKHEKILSVGNENVDSLFTRSAKMIPKDYAIGIGFYSFAKSDPNVLWRSGQPLIDEFKWLKDQGCKSIIDLRVADEYNEVTIDTLCAGFNDLGLQFFHIPVKDGKAPTKKQALEFLNLIQKSEIQPALIHCRSGVGRTSAMAALYRYSIQGWSMRKAIEESRNFKNGVNEAQYQFLCKWAKKYPPGSFKIEVNH